MKYLLFLLLLTSNLYAQDQVDQIIFELSNRSCLVGYYQHMLDTSDTRKEQVEQGKVFCLAYSRAVLKKIKENK